MKELSIEDKARRYDEALRKARIYYDDYKTRDNILYVEDMEDMFPELKEIEDERTRKEIIRFIQMEVEDEMVGNKWLAWLKKQGEYKSPEEVLKIRQELYQSGYNDGYKHGCEDSKKHDKQILANSTKTCDDEHKFKIGDEIKTAKEEPLIVTKIDEEGYWSEDLFICSFDEEHLWDLVEQKPADKVEPKFKVGDIIKPKYRCNAHWQIMQVDMFDKKYRFKNGCVIHFSQEDDYELVEQNSDDRINPKFHKGEWVTNGIETVQITGYDIDYGYQVDYKGNLQHRDTDVIEKEYHLWTIQDAKDGDVLACHGCIVIFKEIDGLNIKCHCAFHYLGAMTTSLFIDTLQNKTAFRPATKEERDLLFEKMKEDCCEWSNEQRKRINELRKLIKI